MVRDTEQAKAVKKLHGFRCQVCGTRLETPAEPYAAAAHIRPLGRAHNGPDSQDNLLCLCPNHHALFDLGAITITDDLLLPGQEAALRMIQNHEISLDHIRYHREHCVLAV